MPHIILDNDLGPPLELEYAGMSLYALVTLADIGDLDALAECRRRITST